MYTFIILPTLSDLSYTSLTSNESLANLSPVSPVPSSPSSPSSPSLLTFGSKTLLEHQLDSIIRLTVDSTIFLVVDSSVVDSFETFLPSYRSPSSIQLIEVHSSNNTNKNTNTNNTLSHPLYPLHFALQTITNPSSPTIILSGDIIYDHSIINGLTSDSRSDLIAVDSTLSSLDGSIIVEFNNDAIIGLSSSLTDHSSSSSFGVSLDLFKLSPSSFLSLKSRLNQLFSSGLDSPSKSFSIYSVLDTLIQTNDYPCGVYDIANYPWLSITSPDDLQLAEIVFHKDLDISPILSKKAFIFDLDGTLILDHQPLDGSIAFLKFLRDLHKHVILLSNNSSRGINQTRQQAADILGLSFTEDEVFTSTHATINYLISHDYHSIFAVGTQAFCDDLSQAGFLLADPSSPSILSTPPDIVVIAFDLELTYLKLKIASLLIQRGIPFILTHGDLVCPTEEGFIPDAGSFLALLRAATSKEPEAILGKPNPFFIRLLCDKLALSPEDLIMVGDRLYTDIRMGIDTGCLTILPLSGETTLADLSSSPYLPDYVFVSMKQLLDYLQ